MRGRSIYKNELTHLTYGESAPQARSLLCRSTDSSVDDGLHNVSRWMTWLPISLKNAAKCDKWYQLQNHPITESLNAKGAREKLSQVNPVHAVSLSVEQTTKRKATLSSKKVYSLSSFETRVLVLVVLFSQEIIALSPSGYLDESLSIFVTNG